MYAVTNRYLVNPINDDDTAVSGGTYGRECAFSMAERLSRMQNMPYTVTEISSCRVIGICDTGQSSTSVGVNRASYSRICSKPG